MVGRCRLRNCVSLSNDRATPLPVETNEPREQQRQRRWERDCCAELPRLTRNRDVAYRITAKRGDLDIDDRRIAEIRRDRCASVNFGDEKEERRGEIEFCIARELKYDGESVVDDSWACRTIGSELRLTELVKRVNGNLCDHSAVTASYGQQTMHDEICLN